MLKVVKISTNLPKFLLTRNAMKYTPCLMISAIKALQIIIKSLQYVTLLQHVLFVIVKVVVKPADLG